MNTFVLKVQDIIKETGDTISIQFKQPGLKKIKFFPGQYLTLVITIAGRKYRRPYSLSSCPISESSHLQVTIKRAEGGLISNYLVDNLKVGESVEVIEPMGDFIYHEGANIIKTIYLWAGGSGIAPVFSILKYILRMGDQKIVLNYCIKTKQDVIFFEKIMKFQHEFQDSFKVQFYYSREKDPSLPGRLTEENIINSLKENADNNYLDSLHYICGPMPLKEQIKRNLIANGFKHDQIFSEDFEKTLNETDLKYISDRTIKFNKFGQDSEIEVPRGKTILDAVLDNLIDIPYSCQNGSCGLCYAQLQQGELKTIGGSPIESELDRGRFPMCCSYPLTDDVSIYF